MYVMDDMIDCVYPCGAPVARWRVYLNPPTTVNLSWASAMNVAWMNAKGAARHDEHFIPRVYDGD